MEEPGCRKLVPTKPSKGQYVGGESSSSGTTDKPSIQAQVHVLAQFTIIKKKKKFSPIFYLIYQKNISGGDLLIYKNCKY